MIVKVELKNRRRRGSRGKDSKRRHHEAWLARIGAAFVVNVHQQEKEGACTSSISSLPLASFAAARAMPTADPGGCSSESVAGLFGVANGLDIVVVVLRTVEYRYSLVSSDRSG